MLRIILSLGLSLAVARASAPDSWALAKDAHFEVYSHAGVPAARAALRWLEQVRAFFLSETPAPPDARPPIRVVGFTSAAEYHSHQFGGLSDAFFVGTATRDYIVLPSLAPEQFRLAVHEYAHAIVHAAGLDPPPWLSDGFAEFLSTVHFTTGGTFLGAEVPPHRQALRANAWIPLEDLLAPQRPVSAGRRTSALFYAESWALTHMLLRSPGYSAGLPQLLMAMRTGTPGRTAFPAVYGKTLDAVTRDLRAWVEGRSFIPVQLPAVTPPVETIAASELTPRESRLMLADLLSAAGQLSRAAELYRQLDQETPNSAAVAAARGAVALRLGQNGQARQFFQRAIELGVEDASVCYRYAVLADMAGQPAGVIQTALERAVQLNPGYDDALYKLALIEDNTGHYESALQHLNAMRVIEPGRLHTYWTTKADALIQLDRREEALAASRHAAEYASTEEERTRAEQLSFVAQTDLSVRFARDASGQTRLESTRVPHDSVDRNPFIEPADHIRRVEARLIDVQCENGLLFTVRTAAGDLKLQIPDPSRVQIRNGPEEFVCGIQPATAVTVVYTAAEPRAARWDGVIRGIDFWAVDAPR